MKASHVDAYYHETPSSEFAGSSISRKRILRGAKFRGLNQQTRTFGILRAISGLRCGARNYD